MKKTIRFTALLGIIIATVASAHAQAPTYTIVDLGVLSSSDASQGNGISPNAIYATGRDLGSGSYHATQWTDGSIEALPNLMGRNYANGYSINNDGIAVGISTTTSFGSSPLPVIWTGGAVAQLPLPAGQTVGRAYSVNGSGTAVGSVNSGSNEVAAIYQGGASGSASIITAMLADGSYMTTAFGINNSGLVAGNGVNPNNAAVNVGLVYNSVTNSMVSVGALAGANGALAFGISNSGYVVGSSMLNQGAGSPYVWTFEMGIQAIPLAMGTSQGSARGVNDLGMVVGTDSSQYAIPFLFDNGTTYRLQDLLSPGSGWDLSTNTSSSAMGISDNGTIVGTGVYNGQVHAFEMIMVPEPGTYALIGVGALLLIGVARRRRLAA